MLHRIGKDIVQIPNGIESLYEKWKTLGCLAKS